MTKLSMGRVAIFQSALADWKTFRPPAVTKLILVFQCRDPRFDFWVSHIHHASPHVETYFLRT